MADTTALPFAKDRKPEYPEVVKREPLNKFDFATLFLQQGGKCAKCGEKLRRGKVRDEHLHALHLGGGNELTNRALWCRDCTKPKDKTDKAAIAKGKRLRGETCNGPKRKIESRGFQRKDAPTLPAEGMSRMSRSRDKALSPWPERVSTLSKDHPKYRKPKWQTRKA